MRKSFDSLFVYSYDSLYLKTVKKLISGFLGNQLYIDSLKAFDFFIDDLGNRIYGIIGIIDSIRQQEE